MTDDALTDEQHRLETLEQWLDDADEILSRLRLHVQDMQAGAYVQPSYVHKYADEAESLRRHITTIRDLFYGLEKMLRKRLDDEAKTAWRKKE